MEHENSFSYHGRHGVIIENFVVSLLASDNFARDEKIDRLLLHAAAVHASNRLDMYATQIIEAEVANINLSLGVSLTYDEFVRLDTPYLAVIEKYPEFARLVKKLIKNETANLNRIKECIHGDSKILRDRRFVDSLEEITHIFILNGESHDEGKNVVLFYVNNKPSFALKLRNLALEERASNFMQRFLSSKCAIQGWEFPDYITESDHGWVRWSKHQDIEGTAGAKTFFRNAGYLIALSSALSITDLNFENIVVNGGSPVPIDLETVCQHCLTSSSVVNSVRTYLLPNSIKYEDGVARIEHCGIGNIFDSEVVRDAQINTRINRAALSGRVLSPLDYLDEIVEGARHGFDLVVRHKSEFLEFVDSLRGIENRVILKSTNGYCTIIESSLHPSLMSEQSGRREYIRQCLSLQSASFVPGNLIDAEVASCVDCDVPRFVSKIDGQEVSIKHLKQSILMDAFTPGYQFARQYLLSLNAEVIDSEMYHLEECFRQSKKVVDLDSLIRGVQHGNLQEAFSESIGSEHDELATICTTYASSKHPIVRFSGSANNNLELKPVGLDMFSGVAGLGYLINKGHIHLPDHEKNLFFDRYLADLTAFKFDGNTILGGALVGPVSCLIPLFGRSLTTSSFVKMIKSELIRRLSSAENLNSESSSLIAGLAGLLALSSAFYIAYPDEAWKRISQLALRKLISRSVSDGDLLLFPYDSMVSTHDSKCLSGLSHGQSGVAYSLAMYGLAYPEAKQECSNLIARTLRFEFENYLKDGNWPDFRFKPGNTESVHKFSWAHGGAGVLLALDFISKNYSIVELDNFLSSINLSHIFQRHLGSAPPFSVLSVATGEMGVELIRRKLLNTEAPVQPQRRRPLGIGIVNGAAGSYLSRLVLNSPEAVKFPLLPHEFVLEDLR